MTRRRSVCIRGTLVLVLCTLWTTVYARPQDDTLAVVNSTLPNATDRTTENSIRYRFRNNFTLSKFVSPVALSFANKSYLSITNDSTNSKTEKFNRRNSFLTNNIKKLVANTNQNATKRPSRLLQGDSNTFKNEGNYKSDFSNRAYQSMPKLQLGEQNQIKTNKLFSEKNKPIIRKVVTKWTDETKYEDLDFSTENINSENDKINDKSGDFKQYTSREDISNESNVLSKDNHPKLTKKVYYKPKPQYTNEFPGYPNNNYPYYPTRPTLLFATPTPTPIITNVGYPPPWPQQNFQILPETTTQRPTKVTRPVKDHYNHYNAVHNNYPQYPVNNYEVTTFEPTSAYTDRIVIRPEEYSASSDDCPTIYLTLNNTFQGQGKEACPDLNIAVNTNVVNKNVVVESEEDTDNSLVNIFGIPLMDDSQSGESLNDDNESADNEEESESTSIENSNKLTNYNANTDQESAEPGSFASPSSAFSTISRPGKYGRPNDNDDDGLSFSSMIDFFKPAFNAFSWLAAINPLSFGFISFILTPIAILFAGTSGIAALFAPFALSYAREAPEEVQFQQPQWFLESDHKHSYAPLTANTNLMPIMHETGKFFSENEKFSIRPTLFYRFKEWMKNLTQKLRNNNRSFTINSRKNKRRKR